MIAAWLFFLVLYITGWLATNCASCNHLLSSPSSCIIFVKKCIHICLPRTSRTSRSWAELPYLNRTLLHWWDNGACDSCIPFCYNFKKNVAAIAWSWEFFIKIVILLIQPVKTKSFVKHDHRITVCWISGISNALDLQSIMITTLGRVFSI